jgi:hypothetical protein
MGSLGLIFVVPIEFSNPGLASLSLASISSMLAMNLLLQSPPLPPPLLDPNPITLSRSPCSYLLHVDDEALIQLPEPNLGDALRLLPTP